MRAIMLRVLLGVLVFAFFVRSEDIEARDGLFSFHFSDSTSNSNVQSSNTVKSPASTSSAPAPVQPSLAPSQTKLSNANPSVRSPSASPAPASSPASSSSPSSSYEGSGPPPGVSYPAVSVAQPNLTSDGTDVMEKPNKISTASSSLNLTLSSNVTADTAGNVSKWEGQLPPLMSNMYRGNKDEIQHLPKLYFNLANSSLSSDNKKVICDLQVQYCQTAGCKNDTDVIEHNFCDLQKGMATMCTCKKSLSRLNQYEWPVQVHDCLIRLQKCIDMCNNKRETNFRQRSDCTNACDAQIGSSCSKPEQYGASYMVSAPGNTPTYQIVDQSKPQNAGTQAYASVALVLVATLVTGLLAGVSW